MQAAINFLQGRRLPGACGTSQVDCEILRRKYRIDSVTLLSPKTCLRLKVIPATQRRIAMKALIDDGNHPALALKTCLSRDVAADLQQLAPRYFKLIAATQVAKVEITPAVTQGLRHQFVIFRNCLALKEMFLRVL
jgi:hypothetical protein